MQLIIKIRYNLFALSFLFMNVAAGEGVAFIRSTLA